MRTAGRLDQAFQLVERLARELVRRQHDPDQHGRLADDGLGTVHLFHDECRSFNKKPSAKSILSWMATTAPQKI